MIQIHSHQCSQYSEPPEIPVALMKHQQKNSSRTVDPECQIFQRYHAGTVGKHSSQDPQNIIQKSDPHPQEKGM